jgi:outer membrane protein TolC
LGIICGASVGTSYDRGKISRSRDRASGGDNRRSDHATASLQEALLDLGTAAEIRAALAARSRKPG